jgi:hypothetical protein
MLQESMKFIEGHYDLNEKGAFLHVGVAHRKIIHLW